MLSPLTLNAAEETVADEIVMLDPPLLVTVWYLVELAPSVTVPNERLDGFADRVPAEATPVPDKVT